MKKIRILIVDDHELVRSGIISLLGPYNDIEITGEAVSGEEAIQKSKTLAPDVILMDISMPGISGLQAAAQIKEETPGIAILILTMHEEKEYLYNTLRMNIDGLLHKSAGKDEVILAIRSAASGNKYYGGSVSELLVNNFLENFTDNKKKEKILLTRREKEIIHLLAKGLSTIEIADTLLISTRTVDTHRSNLIQKYNLKNSSGLIKFAVEYIKEYK